MTTNKVEGHSAIDADGHILEPPDLWEQYSEPRYRDRTAMRWIALLACPSTE